jgi:hypothetical protein
MLKVDELKDYRKWIGVSAQKVYIAVLAAGGWKNVFPTNVPRWASRVRNYFNITPTTLTRLSKDASKTPLRRVQKMAFLLDCHEVQTFNRTHQDYHPTPWGELPPPPFPVPAGCPAKADPEIVHMGIKDSIGTKGALSKYVYKDESKRLWYQMTPGSAIYHYGSHPKHPTLDAIGVEVFKGQRGTPVFKLMSPDNTGGSSELILEDDGYDMLGTVDKPGDIRGFIITDPRHQGSYNYSETVQVGLAAHELRDVKPHRDDTDFYLNPDDRFSALESRLFPEKDPEGKTLADQV